ncbi:MAG: hypothetical protein EOM00_13430 [Clostridia bacterium]|nr:hypothetical protein [Clostridia bacterium]
MNKYNPYVLIEEKPHSKKEGVNVKIYSTPFSPLDIRKNEAKKMVIEDLHNGLIPEDPEYRIQMCISKDKTSWNIRFEIE